MYILSHTHIIIHEHLIDRIHFPCFLSPLTLLSSSTSNFPISTSPSLSPIPDFSHPTRLPPFSLFQFPFLYLIIFSFSLSPSFPFSFFFLYPSFQFLLLFPFLHLFPFSLFPLSPSFLCYLNNLIHRSLRLWSVHLFSFSFSFTFVVILNLHVNDRIFG